MTRLDYIFKKNQNKKTLITFLTGGDPNLEVTQKLIIKMSEAGADIIEIGIPFSDPIAEGTVIQEADIRALKAGTTTDKLFDMVARVRPITESALVFMTYMNPIYTYGTERFMKKCAEAGIDGVIIPDVPYEEKAEVDEACKAAGVTLISMLAPATKEKIHTIANEAEGFLYGVSSVGLNSGKNQIINDMTDILKQVKQVSDIPCAVGIEAGKAKEAADAIIVETAIAELIAEYGNACIEPVCDYIEKIKELIKDRLNKSA